MKKAFILFFLLVTTAVLSAQCPTLVWQDEFNGTSLDLTKWEPQIGDGCDIGLCGWGNNELQYYKAENAEVNNGTLKIIAKKERVRGSRYTSARLRSKNLGDFTFGRFEARIKLPAGQGLWPAFWMLSTNEPYGGWPQSGEIDIMEFIGQDEKTVHGTIHYGDPYPNNQFQGTDFQLYDGSTFAEGFHNYAVEWEPGVIRWYVDDILYQTLTENDVAPYNWPFDAGNQMHFLLNVAVGGNWPGDPDNRTPFPSQMEVDYVRVYDTNFEPSISGDRLVPNQARGEVYTINNAPGGASFNWTVPGGATIVSGAGSSSITVDWGGISGSVTCDVTTSCSTTTFTIPVTVEPPFIKEFAFENFDDAASISLNSTTGTLTEVANPNPAGVNTSALSAQYVRNSAEQYDVLSYSTTAIPDASLYKTRNKKFYMDVQTQAPIGTEIVVQLESSTAASATNYPTGRHSRYVGTVTKNGEWERIVFDYLDAPDGSTPDTDVDQIIILFNSNSFTGDTYYWDNFDSYMVDDGSGTSNTPPTASFTFSTTDLSASFDATGSSDSDGTISTYSWDFGDGNTASGPTTSHSYAAAGDYTVALTVTDNDGATDSQSQVVTVTAPSTGDPTSLHVQSIVTGTASAGKGSKNGTATVTIHDDQENPVANATVSGTFSGTFSESVSGVTGADGTVTFTTSASAKGGVTVDFCVDNVSHGTLVYDAAQNDLTCSISGAKAISLPGTDRYAELELYPNPARTQFTLTDGVDRLRIIDITGKVVLDVSQVYREVDISGLARGTYLVRMEKEGELFTKLLLKQ